MISITNINEHDTDIFTGRPPENILGLVNSRLNGILERHRISFYAFVALTWFFVGVATLTLFISPVLFAPGSIIGSVIAHLPIVTVCYAGMLFFTWVIDHYEYQDKVIQGNLKNPDPSFDPFWLLFLFSLTPIILAAYFMMNFLRA